MSAMMIAVAVIAVALGLFLAFQVLGRYSGRDEFAQAGQLTPVDLEAFENLIDPEEELYLRNNLPPGQFRGVQRTRARAARLYVAALSHNAAVLAAVGESARSHADPAVAATGEELAQRAVRLKVWCLLALLRMDAAYALPRWFSLSNRIAHQYVVVSYMAANLPGRTAA
jgi:hypothetical protein